MTERELNALEDERKEAEQLKRSLERMKDIESEEYTIEEFLDLEQRYVQTLRTYALKRSRIEDAIEDLEPRFRLVLRAHYLDGLTIEQTADEVHYCTQHVYRLRSQALEKLKDK